MNAHRYSQSGDWEQGRSPVGCSPRLHRQNQIGIDKNGVVGDYTLRSIA